MPEVQALKSAISVAYQKPIPLNYRNLTVLEYILRESVTSSYQASWSALTNLAPLNGTYSTATTYEAYPALRADVSHWRVLVYLGLNLLLPLSAILLNAMQSTCQGNTVMQPVVTTLLLDISKVLEQDDAGLCNVETLRSGKKQGDMKVWLKVWGEKQEQDYHHPYHHPMLVPEGSSSSTTTKNMHQRNPSLARSDTGLLAPSSEYPDMGQRRASDTSIQSADWDRQ